MPETSSPEALSTGVVPQEKWDRLYVLIRADLSVAQQAVQAGHAIASFLKSYPQTPWTNGTLVYLSVANEVELYDWLQVASFRGWAKVAFCEPDIGYALTALAIFSPDESATKRLSRLPLALSGCVPQRSEEPALNRSVAGSSPVTSTIPEDPNWKWAEEFQGIHAGIRYATARCTSGFRAGYVQLPVGWRHNGLSPDEIKQDGSFAFESIFPGCRLSFYSRLGESRRSWYSGIPEGFWIGFACDHLDDIPDPALMTPEYRLKWENNGGFHRRGDLWDLDMVKKHCQIICELVQKSMIP